MSWDDYVNAFLVNWTDVSNENKVYQNTCEHGALVGNADGVVWAKTGTFGFGVIQVDLEKEDGSGTEKVTVDEYANLCDAFNNEGTTSKKGGLRINKEKYHMVNYDGDRNVMYLKKNGGGACVAKSGLAYIIGTFNSSLKTKVNGVDQAQGAGVCNLVCEKLQQFLVDNSL